jgi:hypothetical protein
MSLFGTLAFMMASCCALTAANAQLEILSNTRPQTVFSGANRNISIAFHNAGGNRFDSQIRARIFQTTSVSAVSLGESPWKKLQVLPSQTVLESAQLNFPAVKAETRFVIQWLDTANYVIGATSVLTYPTNLFHTLEPFLCRTNFGVLDPGDQLKPLLKAQGISFTDLGEMNLTDFSGRLVILGPFQFATQMPPGFANQVRTIARRDVAVVWLLPPEPAAPPLQPGWERKKIPPSYYCVQKGQTSVVVVQPDLVSSLPDNPKSQIALIYLCNLALNPQPATLPGLSPDTGP